jgi:predicted O-linked N-acetylglucosamine transferase (SPINDLY family)
MDKKVGKKSHLTLSIDDTVLKVAKKKISNISQTTEDMLKVLIDLENANETKIVQEIAETEEEIKRGHGKLLVLRDQLEKVRNETRYNMQETENNRAWRMAFNTYKGNDKMVDEPLTQKASQVLGVEYDNLVELMDEVLHEVWNRNPETMSIDDAQIWENVKKKFARWIKWTKE